MSGSYFVQESIADDVAVQAFQCSYEKLVERFFKESHEFIACQQYKAAKHDIEYFMRLVLLAYHFYKDEGEGGVMTTMPEVVHKKHKLKGG